MRNHIIVFVGVRNSCGVGQKAVSLESRKASASFGPLRLLHGTGQTSGSFYGEDNVNSSTRCVVNGVQTRPREEEHRITRYPGRSDFTQIITARSATDRESTGKRSIATCSTRHAGCSFRPIRKSYRRCRLRVLLGASQHSQLGASRKG